MTHSTCHRSAEQLPQTNFYNHLAPEWFHTIPLSLPSPNKIPLFRTSSGTITLDKMPAIASNCESPHNLHDRRSLPNLSNHLIRFQECGRKGVPDRSTAFLLTSTSRVPAASNFNSSASATIGKAAAGPEARLRAKRIVKQKDTHRESHINAERERRKSMNHLFGTLRSLLPTSSAKMDKCSLITEIMKHIHLLLETLQQLQHEKAQLLYDGSLDRDSSSALSSREMQESQTTSISGPVFERPDSMVTSDCNIKREVQINNFPTNTTMAKELDSNCRAATQITANLAQVHVICCKGDAFITLMTRKRPNLWSAVMKALQEHKLETVSANISTSDCMAFYSLHTRVMESSELSCEAIQRALQEVKEA